MKKIRYILCLSLPLLAGMATSASAQTRRVTQVTMPVDTVILDARPRDQYLLQPLPESRADYGKILGIENYEEMPGDALLPLTREEAETVIRKMIVAARAPGQEEINKAKIVNDFKVEMLRRRLLEDALRRSYAGDVERRMDKLENFILLLLANNGLDQNAVERLIASLNGTPMPGQNVVGADSRLVPGASDGSSPVALAPGAKASSWEHFLSQVFYDYDSSKLSDEAKRVLDDVAGWVKENNMGVTLRGWASPEGKMSYNNKLSGRRVQAAADYLKSKGVSSSMLKVIPSGIDSMKDTKSKYPAGRRVDIRPDYGEKPRE